MSESTQSRRPWHATARSVFQAVVGFLVLLPQIVEAAGINDSLPWVAGALAVSGAVTRVMALPGVDRWLARFLPFLAADPVKGGSVWTARKKPPSGGEAVPSSSGSAP